MNTTLQAADFVASPAADRRAGATAMAERQLQQTSHRNEELVSLGIFLVLTVVCVYSL